MRILYKILFEVKVFHEYYHTDSNRQSVFDNTLYKTQLDRLSFLESRYTLDQPSISDNIEFVLPASLVERFRNQHLVLLKSYSGFQVAVAVREIVLTSDATAYAPLIPLDDDFNIVILMKQEAGQFSRLTQSRASTTVQSFYYFSNEKLASPKTAPVLSAPISAKDTTYNYEQGELSDDGTNICIFYADTGGDHFPAVTGDGFVNENDRILVPTRFDYSFDPADAVTNAQFVLKDSYGNQVHSITISNSNVLSTVSLDFNGNDYMVKSLPYARIIDSIPYSLEVTGNGGYSKILKLIFYGNTADLSATWAVIQVQNKVGDPAFCLLDTNGFINKPVLPDGSTAAYPIFEIRCKSLFTFWKYSNDTDKTLQLTTGLKNFLNTGTDIKKLVSLEPFPSTFLPYFVKNLVNTGDNTLYYLPNPAVNEMVEAESNQLFSNIVVQDSKLFPAT